MNRGAAGAPSRAVVVYTAITGRYDSLKPQPREATQGAEFVAFLDAPRPSKTWQTRTIHDGFSDPALNAKIHKILPHRYFPHARYSLWIDGSVTILFAHPIERLIDLYLADCDLAVFQHSSRICLYQEADVCVRRRLDDPALILRQVARYTREGYPANAGLAECTVMLRRHSPAVEAFNDAWWDELLRSSRRDQLSFPYVAAKVGLRYATFPGTLKDNELFHRTRHAAPVAVLASRMIRRRIEPRISGISARARAALISARRRPPQRCLPSQASSETHVEGESEKASRAAATSASGSAPATRMPSERRVVAIGPVRDYPSWGWVGFDTARELSRYFDIVLYDAWTDPPDCDVILAVKEPPPAPFIDVIRKRGTRLIYCPVDSLIDRDHLMGQADVFRACDMVLVHSERLLPLVTRYCANTHFVEHHARFVTPPPAAFRESGYVLWVGGYQYVPYLVRWLDQHPVRFELRILSDVDNYRARGAARILAAEIGVKLTRLGEGRYPGVSLLPWSERLQEELMRECRAAMDVKAIDSFNQYYKPPTKAQQMIASGIPFAVNPESYSAEYFHRRGFDLAAPSDQERWFSPEYWKITQQHGQHLRATLSLEAVGRRYRELIDAL